MKNWIALCILIVAGQALYAGDGIVFHTGGYDSAFGKAVAEEKLMLLDFTASWCMPCKKMEKEVFPDADLGQFVNENFIPFQVDADYAWGMEIVKEFNVKAFPTLLVVDNKGKVVKRITGYNTAAELLTELHPLGDYKKLFSPD